MFRRNFIYSLITLTLSLETSAIAHAADLTAAERPKQTLDAVLMAEFRRDPTAYVDLATGAFTMTGKVVFDSPTFASEELPNLKILAETGQWIAPSGRHYDLRPAQMYFRDGTGGFGDQLANLASRPRRGWRPSVGVEPAVVYHEGMTASDFLEETIRGLGVDRYHLDGASGAIVVSVLHLSLRDLPEAFAAKVIALVTPASRGPRPRGRRTTCPARRSRIPSGPRPRPTRRLDAGCSINCTGSSRTFPRTRRGPPSCRR